MSKHALSPIFLDRPDAGPLLVTRSHRNRIAFGWYGGKFNHLKWLLPLLPDMHHYCEPFAGSAAVLLNRVPAPIETYNDIDGEVVHFFRVLRAQPKELARTIALTPFSREEFYRAIQPINGEIDDIERARQFYVRARQTRTGLAQTATLGRWANCKNTSRNSMAGSVSRWLGGVKGLSSVAERLLRVQIENRPATEIIRVYDNERTLFYCDPPYLPETRGDVCAYGYEMSLQQHIELADVLQQCRGKVAISGYRCQTMDDLYGEWRRFDALPRRCHSIKELRHESVWMNY